MNGYRALADLVVVLHCGYVAVVVLGMAAIVIGIALHWQWIRNFWFRLIHLLMIAIVVIESLLGIVCPLTRWEDRLRDFAGETNESASFIGYWVGRLLFVDVPPAILTAAYCLFGAAVVAAWLLAPPRGPRNAR